jgi:bifunctional non-homologous end joining protein LigD
VLLGVDGIADFNGLHSRKHDDEVQLYAFDVLMRAGDDLRPLPLMLLRRVDGIILNDFEQGEIGPELFRAACNMGLEGILSKHKDRPYRAGRSTHWTNVNVTGDEPAGGYVRMKSVWMYVDAGRPLLIG